MLAAACGGEPASATAEVPSAPGAAVLGATLPPFTVRARWPDASALRYRIDEAGSPLTSEQLRADIACALAQWSSTGLVGFVEDEQAPDIVFRWLTNDEDATFGRDTGVARTGPVGPGCAVEFNADAAWGEGLQLETAALHEIGHVLGLDHVEHEGSIMHPQRERASPRVGPVDRAALGSLYGDGAEAPAGSLVGPGFALHGVAPAGLTDWTVFDTDGDGRDELLVWATGDVGHGALTIYRFAPGPRLEETRGPFLELAGHGASVAPSVDGTGRRLLDVRWPDGSGVRRTFDARGIPREPRPHQLPAGASTTIDRGDLDGDGEVEVVRRVGPRS